MPVRDPIQVAFDLGVVGGLSDGQLLERFIERREGVIFEAIVRRHAPMVWGVCRRVLRNHHDAEDAFQATFLVLARKASTVRPRDRVGPWLHGVACRASAKARATDVRRRAREAQAAATAPVADGADGDLPDESLAYLDREVRRLPEKYRVPVILCELEGKTHREAVEHLGWPVGTVSGRLSRARAILARRLKHPGPADLVLPPLATLAPRVVPARLIGPLARFVLRPSADLVASEAVLLTKGVVRTMWISQLKATTTVMLGCALAAGTAGLTYRAMAGDGPGPQQTAPMPGQANPPNKPTEPPISAEAPAPAPADPITGPYPFVLNAEEVHELPDLQIDYGDFHLKTGSVAIMPIRSEGGITGAMILGNGTFDSAHNGKDRVEGRERAVILRFHPTEQAAILPLDRAKRITDPGIAELTRQMIMGAQRFGLMVEDGKRYGNHMRGVLIPPRGNLFTVIYSREQGDLYHWIDTPK